MTDEKEVVLCVKNKTLGVILLCPGAEYWFTSRIVRLNLFEEIDECVSLSSALASGGIMCWRCLRVSGRVMILIVHICLGSWSDLLLLGLLLFVLDELLLITFGQLLSAKLGFCFSDLLLPIDTCGQPPPLEVVVYKIVSADIL